MTIRHSIPSLFRTGALSLLCVSSVAIAAVPGDVTLPPAQRSTLANGAEVILVEKRDTPLVSMEILVRGGSLADAAGKEGTATLLAELLSKGAGQRDAAQFAEAIEAAGGGLSTQAGTETLGLSASFLAEDTGLMLELASDALLRPRLDATEFDKLRQRSIDGIAAAKDGDVGGLVPAYGYARLFAGHPYGRPSGGDETSLATIGQDDVKRYYAEQVGGDRLVIVVVGDIDAKALQPRIAEAFGGFRKATGTLPEVAAAPKRTGRQVLLIDKPGSAQTYFWLGNVGVPRRDPDDAARTLANTVFGGRFTSMLNTELRIKSGLSYGARSSLDRLATPGAVSIGSFTRTDATVQAIDLALATLDRFHQEGLSAEMLESSRNYVLGQFPPDLETNGQIADTFADLALYGLPVDDIDGYAERIAAVDAAGAAKAIGSTYPASGDLVLVLIGDAAKIREGVAKYGPVTEMKISEKRFAPQR